MKPLTVERMRAPEPPPDAEWPWEPDRETRPAPTVTRLVVDEAASLEAAAAAGHPGRVTRDDIVERPIEVPVPHRDYGGPTNAMSATYPLPDDLDGERLCEELWVAGVAVNVMVAPTDDGEQVLRLTAPTEFDTDAAGDVIDAHEGRD